MIVPDLNVLIYSNDSSLPQHESTRLWWDQLLSSNESVGLCMPVISGFVRLTTHRRVFRQPLQVTEAIERVNSWLDQPYVVPIYPSARHWEIMAALLASVNVGGNLVTDTEIAAYAIELHATIATNDADFERFDGVNLINPTTAD